MKSKIKTFLYGLLVVLYAIGNTVEYVAAVKMFLIAINSSGIITIGTFLLSVLFASIAVLWTFQTKSVFNKLN